MVLNILVAEDHPLFLDAIKEVLRSAFSEANLREATNYPQLLGLLKENPSADLILMDLAMPGMSGLAGVRAVQEAAPRVPLIVLSATEARNVIRETLEAGAVGYVVKSAGSRDIRKAIQTVLGGGVYVPAEMHDLPAARQPATPSPLADGGRAAPRYFADSTDSMGNMLNMLWVGVMQVNRQGLVRFLNQAASRILALGDSLTLDHAGMCRCKTPERTRQLLDLITRAAMPGNGLSFALSLERQSGARPVDVMATPLPAAPGQEGEDPAVVLFVTHPDICPEPSLDILRSLYGLTRSEARIVLELVKGRSVDEAAEHLGLRLSTARSYLKSVFVKTGANRQADLVRMVMTGPAFVAAPE